MITPGIYPFTSREDYDAVDAINQSLIKTFVKNPLAWKHGYPPVDSEEALWGRLFELCLFGKDPWRFFAIFDILTQEQLLAKAKERVPRTKTFSKNLKEYQDWKREMKAKEFEIITGKKIREANVAVLRCKEDPSITQLLELGGLTDVMLIWRDPDTNLLCKGLVDYAATGDHCLTDVKTASCIVGQSPEDAARKFYYHARDFGYHIQSGCYIDGWQLAQEQGAGRDAYGYGNRHGWRFIVSGNKDPWPAAAYSYPQSEIEEGRAIWRRGLKQYQECLTSGLYPGLTTLDGFVELRKENWQ